MCLPLAGALRVNGQRATACNVCDPCVAHGCTHRTQSLLRAIRQILICLAHSVR